MAAEHFFCVGVLFVNLTALATPPRGHNAGLGVALIGSLTTFISLPLGCSIGRLYDGGVLPLVTGFAISGDAYWIIEPRIQRDTN
jgi:DHA1 family bicyclomycin/chloramphenicol resistance-like MFS transporter